MGLRRDVCGFCLIGLGSCKLTLMRGGRVGGCAFLRVLVDDGSVVEILGGWQERRVRGCEC